MNHLKDLTGYKFGYLTVVKRGEDRYSSSGRRIVTWDCICDCGNVKKGIDGNNLKKGNVSSCGCMWHVNRSDYNYEVGQVINGYKIIKRYRKNNKKWYKYICLSCKYENNVPEGRISFGHGCPVCSKNGTFKGFNDLWTTNPEISKLLADIQDGYKYSKSSKEKVNWICPNCNYKINQKSISNVVRFGLKCQCCSDGFSYPNKMMLSVLNNLKEVDYFETEYSPEWIKPRRYDFYIPKFNLIIEMDGGIGHGKNDVFKSLNNEESIKIDNQKDQKAKLHGLSVIRIDADYKNVDKRFEYIKSSILSSELEKVFDLEKIDWVKIEKRTNSSLMIEFIDFINLPENINKPVSVLSKNFGIPNTTANRYIDRGIKQGICKYKKYTCSKIVNQYSLDGTLLHTYQSAAEAGKKNKISSPNIVNCCNGICKTAHGYIWKYAS